MVQSIRCALFCLSPHFFQTIDACITITQIQVDSILIQDEVQQLYVQQIANPIAYPALQLPTLLSQFDNCPTAPYILARRLPEALPFESLRVRLLRIRKSTDSSPDEPERKQRMRVTNGER